MTEFRKCFPVSHTRSHSYVLRLQNGNATFCLLFLGSGVCSTTPAAEIGDTMWLQEQQSIRFAIKILPKAWSVLSFF